MISTSPVLRSARSGGLRRSRIAHAVVALVLLSAVPAFAQDEEAEVAEKPFSLMSRMLGGKTDSVAALAREQVGLKYRYGARQPGKAFDCSGLVQYVMSKFDLSLPRTARDQAKVGTEVPKDERELKPGDLLYFGRGKSVTHIGIYVGDGRYVHAANRRKGVIESPLPKGTRRTRFWRGVRRLLHLPDSAAVAQATSALDTIRAVPTVTTGTLVRE
jgi:hypothetical protein